MTRALGSLAVVRPTKGTKASMAAGRRRSSRISISVSDNYHPSDHFQRQGHHVLVGEGLEEERLAGLDDVELLLTQTS